MSLECEIARAIYEEVRNGDWVKKSVRLALYIPEVHRIWPAASREQIIRACLIAYGLLILDVAEAVGKEKPTVSFHSAEEDYFLNNIRRAGAPPT